MLGAVWPPQGICLWLMAEDVNWQWEREAALWKSRIPLLRNETHVNKGKSLLMYDRSDFDKFSRKFDWWKFKVKEKNHKGPKVTYVLNPEVYAGILGKPAFLKGKLYCSSSDLTINFICRGVLVNPYKIPLLNTALLVTSGVILTISHIYLRIEKYLAAFRSLLMTIGYGLVFLYVQGYEYCWSCFAMNDGVYGSIFYMLTGFHGFHVIIGTIFLIVCAFRMKFGHFTHSNHFAFESAIWYWHFVDVVWILLYLLVYLWPNAVYFGSKGWVTVFPYENITVITLNTRYFYQFCNQQPGFHFYAGINFEYHYDLKEKVMKYILNFFSKTLYDFEYRNRIPLKEVWRRRYYILLRYTKW